MFMKKSKETEWFKLIKIQLNNLTLMIVKSKKTNHMTFFLVKEERHSLKHILLVCVLTKYRLNCLNLNGLLSAYWRALKLVLLLISMISNKYVCWRNVVRKRHFFVYIKNVNDKIPCLFRSSIRLSIILKSFNWFISSWIPVDIFI